MILFQEILFPIAQDIFDMEHISQEEDKLIIPLKQTKDNQARYDDAYALIGENSGFLIDITYANLELIIKLNAIDQFDFLIGATYKEFHFEDVPDIQLDKYNTQFPISLSDDELISLSPILFELFDEHPLVENLRSQVARAIPQIHMKDTMLFSEELTQDGYRGAWVTKDFNRCVLAVVDDIGNKNGLVKAYVFD